MKKIENSFLSDITQIRNNKEYKKIEKFIKNNVLLIPLIYIVGIISLIFRNQFLKLPLNYISIIQLAIILAYLVVYVGCYTVIEVIFIKLFEKGNKIKNVGMLLFLEFCAWYMIFWFVQDLNVSIVLLLIFYLIWPILAIFLKKIKNYINLLTITMFIVIILFIPIQYWGFKGQNVIYHNYESKEEIEYTYHGNYDELYQFTSEDKVFLIPIDSGYIEYKK